MSQFQNTHSALTWIRRPRSRRCDGLDHLLVVRSVPTVPDSPSRRQPWSRQWVGWVEASPHVATNGQSVASHLRLKSTTNPAVKWFLWRKHTDAEPFSKIPHRGLPVLDPCDQWLLWNCIMRFSEWSLQYRALCIPATPTRKRLPHVSWKQRMLLTSTMPSFACWLQYIAVLTPSILKVGRFVHMSCKQSLLRTSTMLSSACCLQYIAALLPRTLKIGCLVHLSCEYRLLRTCTIESSAFVV